MNRVNKPSILSFLVILLCIFNPNEGSSQFSEAQVIVACNTCNPTSFSCGDLNNDGYEDIVSASNKKLLAWHENLEGKSFSDQIVIDQIPKLSLVATEDIDLDEQVDIVAVTSDQKLYVYKRNSDGGYSVDISFEIKNRAPKEMHLVNMDQDKELEIVLFYRNGLSYVDISATPLTEKEVIIDNVLFDINILDVNNDGFQDFIALSQSGELISLLNEGKGEFKLVNLIKVADKALKKTSIKSDDFDNDQDIDIIVASPELEQISYFENLGKLQFSSAKQIAGKKSYDNLFAHIIDVDNDGDSDVLADFPYNAQGLSWMENKGDGIFSVEEGYPEVRVISNYSNMPNSFINFDFNNDGFMDMGYIDQRVNLLGLYVNNQKGRFEEIIISEGATLVNDIDFADLNGDQQQELLSSSKINRQLSHYSTNEEGVAINLIASSEYVGHDLKPADYDGDGDTDIASFAFSFDPNALCWYENIADGKEFKERPISSPKGVNRILNVDIDNDGDQDLLYSKTYLGSRIACKINDGKGGFLDSMTVSTQRGRYILGCPDINNDGLPDIVYSDRRNKKSGWIKNLGNGKFMDVTLKRKNNYAKTFCKDIDSDGDLDLIFASKKISIMRNTDNGELGDEIFIGDFGEDIIELDVADIDNDLDKDIIAGTKKGLIISFINSGNDTYELKKIIDLPSRIKKILCFDFDNDGDNDIVITIPGEDKIIWLSNLQ